MLELSHAGSCFCRREFCYYIFGKWLCSYMRFNFVKLIFPSMKIEWLGVRKSWNRASKKRGERSKKCVYGKNFVWQKCVTFIYWCYKELTFRGFSVPFILHWKVKNGPKITPMYSKKSASEQIKKAHSHSRYFASTFHKLITSNQPVLHSQTGQIHSQKHDIPGQQNRHGSQPVLKPSDSTRPGRKIQKWRERIQRRAKAKETGLCL